MPYKDKEKQKAFGREWMRKKRLELIEKLGGKCVYCGCDIQEALEINHINGGGRKERKAHCRPHYENINEFELTCIVCNAWHKAVKLKSIENKWSISWK